MAAPGTIVRALSVIMSMLASGAVFAQEQIVRVDLAYRAPGSGPAPNFSPKGTQVPLTDLPVDVTVPEHSTRPARTGTIKIGPDERSWLPVLVTAEPGHPKDLCRLYPDRNRNGNFADDGPALAAIPTVREKTGDSWSSFSRVEVPVFYGGGTEAYMVNIWIVRQGEAAPDVLRYSVSSWRSGAVTIRGVEALVAAMDGNNDAVFDKRDTWSVLEASSPDAQRRVLSFDEARATDRLMFVKTATEELVLEFRSLSADGRSLSMAVVDRPVTKAEDRAGDDTVASERSRPRAREPFGWETRFDAAMARAGASGRKVILDFWTTWCGPCRQMDEWIWSDAEVAAALNAGFVGVKLDGDVEKALVKRFAVTGYPTVVVLDPAGKELRRFAGYKGSKDVLDFLTITRVTEGWARCTSSCAPGKRPYCVTPQLRQTATRGSWP